MTQEEVMTYIAECNNLENLGDILENVQGRLEVISEVIEEE
jgi:hypothetical protein